MISSLPYFSKQRTDSQCIDGVFDDFIAALRALNTIGYGIPESSLQLNLVYKPMGTFLSGNQAELEDEFKRQLRTRYRIEFNNLLGITNLRLAGSPITCSKRAYTRHTCSGWRLIKALDPAALSGPMCRNTISVGSDGYLYDWDCNQVLDVKVECAVPHIDDFDYEALVRGKIAINQHCCGCTASAGSSCGGEINLSQSKNVSY